MSQTKSRHELHTRINSNEYFTTKLSSVLNVQSNYNSYNNLNNRHNSTDFIKTSSNLRGNIHPLIYDSKMSPQIQPKMNHTNNHSFDSDQKRYRPYNNPVSDNAYRVNEYSQENFKVPYSSNTNLAKMSVSSYNSGKAKSIDPPLLHDRADYQNLRSSRNALERLGSISIIKEQDVKVSQNIQVERSIEISQNLSSTSYKKRQGISGLFQGDVKHHLQYYGGKDKTNIEHKRLNKCQSYSHITKDTRSTTNNQENDYFTKKTQKIIPEANLSLNRINTMKSSVNTNENNFNNNVVWTNLGTPEKGSSSFNKTDIKNQKAYEQYDGESSNVTTNSLAKTKAKIDSFQKYLKDSIKNTH